MSVRDIVAMLLAATVLLFIVGTVLRVVLHPQAPTDPASWQTLMGVIVGALAAFISGGTKP